MTSPRRLQHTRFPSFISIVVLCNTSSCLGLHSQAHPALQGVEGLPHPILPLLASCLHLHDDMPQVLPLPHLGPTCPMMPMDSDRCTWVERRVRISQEEAFPMRAWTLCRRRWRAWWRAPRRRCCRACTLRATSASTATGAALTWRPRPGCADLPLQPGSVHA